MSKLHDDLINEIEPAETAEESVHALMLGIADRIESCHGNPVRLSDLCTILREDPTKVASAVLANTPSAKTQKTRSTAYDAPSAVFDRPRENVRQGMLDSTNDHRDQVFPPTDKTEAERERLRREQTAHDRGQAVVANEELPEAKPETELNDPDLENEREREREHERMTA